MTNELKIGVMGAGAIGCFLGGKLLAHGVDVVFVGRERLKADIEKSGLAWTELNGETVVVPGEKVVFRTAPASMADRDVVLCCVKSAATAETAAELARVLSPSAIVVSMQNGLRNAEVLRAGLGERAVLGGIVSFNVVASGATFRQATSGPLVIEASAAPRVEALATALRGAGFEVQLATDIRGMQWAKLVMNVNNAVGALTDVPTARLLFEKDYRRIVAALMAESLEVMRRAGVKPARLGPIPARFFPMLLRLPTPVLRLAARAQLKVDPEARSSMWDDVSRGRLTEVDYLNGEIVRLAASCGAEAPLNRRVVTLIHDVEKAGKGSPKLDAAALWAALNL